MMPQLFLHYFVSYSTNHDTLSEILFCCFPHIINSLRHIDEYFHIYYSFSPVNFYCTKTRYTHICIL